MTDADLAEIDRQVARREDMAEFIRHHPEYRRVEPTTGLLKGQAYVHSTRTDIRATFARFGFTTPERTA